MRKPADVFGFIARANRQKYQDRHRFCALVWRRYKPKPVFELRFFIHRKILFIFPLPRWERLGEGGSYENKTLIFAYTPSKLIRQENCHPTSPKAFGESKKNETY